MHRRIIPVAFVVVLLLASSATAKPEVIGEVSATEIRMGAGDTTDSGLLAAYRLDQALDPQTSGITFQLNAPQVRVDTYQMDPVLVTSSVNVIPPNPGYQPDSRIFTTATIESSIARAGYKFSVVAPDGGARSHITSDCSNQTTPDRTSFDAPVLVAPPAEPVRVDVANSVQWHGCGTSQMTVTGRFVVVLFEIDSILTTADETVELPSGDAQSSFSPLAPSGEAYVTHRRQQYLYVDDGTITFDVDSSPHFVFLDSPQVEPRGTVEFRGANGRLQATQTWEVHADNLVLAGSMQLATQTTGGRIESVLMGRVDSAMADGHPVTLTSTVAAAAGPGSSLSRILGVGLVGVVVPVAVFAPRTVRAVRDRRMEPELDEEDAADAFLQDVEGVTASGPFGQPRTARQVRIGEDALRPLRYQLALERARGCFQAEDYRASTRWTRRALRVAPGDFSAHLLLARCLDQLGHRQRATYHRWLAASVATRPGADLRLAAEIGLDGAASAACAGNDPAAETWLRGALRADPRIRREVEGTPDLGHLLERIDAQFAAAEETPDWLRP
ncbi:MAG TPA: bacterial transcriptional activator domain-containing protein [Candidatus Thermoplasmatota archaeon]|nr:bacterial transcriptional activator domain-containing protein [Candidatus Thermoplasmatota archaeon]